MKRLTFLTGYYGSGKSEIAVNLAVQKKLDTIVDLDIINPYFRSRELEDEMALLGIESISSDIDARASLDMPYISSKIYKPFHHKETKAIYDLGGNDQGAKLMRQFEDYQNIDIDLLLVVNIYRYETNSVENILKLINKIEGMGGFKVTGLINNSNLLRDTVEENLLDGQAILKEVSNQTGLPVKFTTVWDQVDITDRKFLGELIKLKLYLRKDWL